jgi:glutamate:GABA antiporter
MGLRDVTLFAIACMVGTRWAPAAAHAGAGSITLWLLAAAMFVAPLAAAVGALVVKYPGTGGLYLWARNDFGPWHGFLCFWVYWMGNAVWFPSASLFYMSAGLHMLGGPYARFAEDQFWLVSAALAAIWIALGTNIAGVRIGKWTENAGAIAAWALASLLAVAALLVWRQRGSATPIHLAPHWNWGTVGLLSSVAYGMTGLEMAGLMGGEIRDPNRTLPRAGWIAAAFATLFYAGSTGAILALVPASKVSELEGYAQAGGAAGAALAAWWIAPLVGVLTLASALGQIGGIGTSVSRLPLAVGADHLPSALTRVHPRWRTPHVSIIALGAVASLLLVAFQLGDSMRAAYRELVSLMVIVGFLPYLYIFASAWKAGKRVSAISGSLVTALAVACAVIPPGDVASVWLFEAKLAAGTAAVIGTAWWAYRRAVKRGAMSKAF